ncbi:MAG: exonuclease domain-containing protein [Defluviitaleaceae bacterium]|nr:exonuclease domain-containing protein [Defluviitaleaceae bacterium]
MKYIVLDLEFNQAFDFGKGKSQLPDERCPFEIIQIGAIRLNHKFEYEASLNLLIKPVIYKKLHPYVRRITGLNKTMLNNKQSFTEAFTKLSEFVGKNQVVYCVWGINDIRELRKNMDYYGLIDEAWAINFIDVQNIASKHLNRVPGMCIGLKNAVTALNLEINKPFHNALHDAEYTAKILHLLKKEPLNIMCFTRDNIVQVKKLAPKVNFSILYKFIEDKMGRALTKKEKWIFKNVYLGGKLKIFDRK